MLLKSIKINGLLSFRDAELEMRPLNVLVGPNASGKSNFIEIMALLQALPRNLVGFFQQNGGVGDWLWRGASNESTNSHEFEVEAIVHQPHGRLPLRYALGIYGNEPYPIISTERLEEDNTSPNNQGPPFRFFDLRFAKGSVAIQQRNPLSQITGIVQSPESRHIQELDGSDLSVDQSFLGQRKDPMSYPEMYFLTQQFDSIRLYRDWNMGRNSAMRRPQPTDALTDHLYEDFSNLALVLNRLKREPVMPAIEEQLSRFYETYESLGVDIFGNTAQLWIREKSLANPVPAARLSDGTLRFLALLSIMANPNPPPLICIEEPELGLHPDVIHQVAKLLIEASKRTQLIVTTHSAELIDHLWEDPESVVVCERYPDTGTEFSRLKKDDLTDWLERYELGELWRTGEIGGNRW